MFSSSKEIKETLKHSYWAICSGVPYLQGSLESVECNGGMEHWNEN